MHSDDVVIVAATRTPIGCFQGALSTVSAVDMGAAVINNLLRQSGVSGEMIDEVILGQVLTAGCGQNPARQTALRAGLPVAVPAFTINQVCGSGLKAVHLAIQAIRCGDAEVIIAGGQESMSMAPHVLTGTRAGIRLGHSQLTDTVVNDGLWDSFGNYHMGITAENLAAKYSISRSEQDEFAFSSQQKTLNAQSLGKFEDEITSIQVKKPKNDVIDISHDEQPRAETTLDGLSKLRAVFIQDGTVTAGNASSLNDGAAGILLMSASRANELGLKILARIRGYASSGVDPAIMGIGPVSAVKLCLKKSGWNLEDIDLIEANEAFAAQALAVGKELEWNSERVNVNGGAIALGHPIGASGCRILVTLIYEMHRRNAQKGLATLCIGGGQGVALTIERM